MSEALHQVVVWGPEHGDGGSVVAVPSSRVFRTREAAFAYLPVHHAAVLVDKLTRIDGHRIDALEVEEAPRFEMTVQEVTAHALAIAATTTEARFVEAFSAYVADVVARESEPYEKVALFVHGMVEGLRETVAELMVYRGGGAS